MRLTAGSTIKEHADHDLNVDEGTARIHIPVSRTLSSTLTECASCSRQHLICAAVRPASRAQQRRTDRVHMVIDATVNSWLKDLLVTASEFA
jgi:hypothetical protein